MYATGTCIIRYDINRKKQLFLMGSQDCVEITALSLSTSKRFMAFSEITEKVSQIVIYDLRLMVVVKNIILEKVTKNTRVIMVKFSEDDKFLYVQIGAPEWKIFQYKLDKSVLSMIIDNVPPSYDPSLHNDASYNDNDYFYEMNINKDPRYLISAVGKGYLRVFSLKKGSYDYIDISRPGYQSDYLCHCWINNFFLMAGTKDGRIDVFDYTGNYLDSLENAHEVMQGNEENPIFSICSLKDGFALTGRNVVTIYKFNSLVSLILIIQV